MADGEGEESLIDHMVSPGVLESLIDRGPIDLAIHLCAITRGSQGSRDSVNRFELF